MSETPSPILEAQRHLWTIGHYPAIARHLLPISIDVVESTGITAGDRVLDVAVGDGNTALEAARREAIVTGVDLTPAQLALAQARAAADGLSIELHEANAESLPLPDAAFDVVASVMGVIFAPDHRRAAQELTRVCRPGGQVAVTAWATNDSWFSTWRDYVTDLVPPPPPGSPDPDAWGDPTEMANRLQAAGLDVSVETRAFSWEFSSLQEGMDFFLTNAGPFIAFMEAASAQGKGDHARATLHEALEATNRGTNGRLQLDSPYLLALARR